MILIIWTNNNKKILKICFKINNKNKNNNNNNNKKIVNKNKNKNKRTVNQIGKNIIIIIISNTIKNQRNQISMSMMNRN